MKSLDVGGMLALPCGAKDIGIIKPTTEHDMAGMRCFARDQFGKPVMVEYYSGTLMYTSLYRYKDVERRYSEGVMSVSMKGSQICALHISDDVKSGIGEILHTSIVPSRFNPLRYTNLFGTWKETVLYQWYEWCKRRMREWRT